MRVYLDTGVFVDYFVYHAHYGKLLRRKGRRNRTIQQLHQDVSECFNKIRTNHDGVTSCLTAYEAEDALFTETINSLKGVRDKRKMAVMSSCGITSQVMLVKQFFNLRMVDLTEREFVEKNKQIDLQFKGIEAGDSLHIATAILTDADLIISTDRHLLALNNTLKNSAGTTIQCLDTNDAKQIL